MQTNLNAFDVFNNRTDQTPDSLPEDTDGSGSGNGDHNNEPSKLLRPGTVVALHSPAHNRFVRLISEKVDAHGGPMDFDKLPLWWDSELFSVVDAGNGEVALHNPAHGTHGTLASLHTCVFMHMYT